MDINSDLTQKIKNLNDKKQQLLATKSTLEQQKQTLDSQITAAGYDPAKLPETIETLNNGIIEFESKVTPIVANIEAQLAQSENAQFAASDVNSMSTPTNPAPAQANPFG